MRLASLAALSVMGLLAACSSDTPTAPALGRVGITACGNVTLTRANPKTSPISVPANSTGNDVAWFIKNLSGSPITLFSETPSGSGTVTNVVSGHWVPFPYTLPSGTQIDADVMFDAGGSGTSGTVGNVVHTSCGDLVLPAFTVNVP